MIEKNETESLDTFVYIILSRLVLPCGKPWTAAAHSLSFVVSWHWLAWSRIFSWSFSFSSVPCNLTLDFKLFCNLDKISKEQQFFLRRPSLSLLICLSYVDLSSNLKNIGLYHWLKFAEGKFNYGLLDRDVYGLDAAAILSCPIQEDSIPDCLIQGSPIQGVLIQDGASGKVEHTSY